MQIFFTSSSCLSVETSVNMPPIASKRSSSVSKSSPLSTNNPVTYVYNLPQRQTNKQTALLVSQKIICMEVACWGFGLWYVIKGWDRETFIHQDMIIILYAINYFTTALKCRTTYNVIFMIVLLAIISFQFGSNRLKCVFQL